jgi:hypothetical protein
MNGFEAAESGADDDHVMGAGGGPRRHRVRSLAAAETPQLQTSAAARRLFSLMSCDLAIQATSGAREPFRARKRFIPPLCGSRIQSWQRGAAEVPAVTPSRKLTAKFLFRFTETRVLVDQKKLRVNAQSGPARLATPRRTACRRGWIQSAEEAKLTASP